MWQPLRASLSGLRRCRVPGLHDRDDLRLPQVVVRAPLDDPRTRVVEDARPRAAEDVRARVAEATGLTPDQDNETCAMLDPASHKRATPL